MEGLLEVEAIMHVPAVSNEVEKLGNMRDLTLPRFLDLFGAMWGDLENVRITYFVFSPQILSNQFSNFSRVSAKEWSRGCVNLYPHPARRDHEVGLSQPMVPYTLTCPVHHNRQVVNAPLKLGS